MKIICSSWEKEQLINLISEASKDCKNCPINKKCFYCCEDAWNYKVDWELENDNEKLKQERDELLNMLVKIAYAKWNWEEVYDLMTKYGYEDKEEDDY